MSNEFIPYDGDLEHIKSIGVDDNPDVQAAYAEKVAEHAEVTANAWLCDWGKFVGTISEKTNLTTDQVLLYEILMFLKGLHKEVHRLSVDLSWMHAHAHDRHMDDCPFDAADKNEEWKS
jgi:hypothetical protein